MNRTKRFFVSVLLAVMTFPSLLGCAEGDSKTGVIKADTPQALAQAYHRALRQKDWRSCFLCFDPKMRGEYLREMLFVQGMSEDLKLAAIVNKWLKSDPARPDATFPQVREDDRVPDGVLIYEALQKRSNDLAGFVDEFCRQNDARGRGLFPSFGEVKEIQIRGETAVGYWTPPPVIPIGPTLSTPSGKGGGGVEQDNMNAAEPQPAVPKLNRRWFQFSLRTLLVFVTLCAIPCSWLAVKIHEEKSLRDEKNRQWRVVQAIERSSGVLEECSIRAFEIIEIRPKWLNDCLGGHYHGQITELDFSGSLIKDGDLESLKSLCNLQRLRLDNTSITDAGLQHLECLPKLYRLSLSGTHISEAGLIKLQQALPNCKIER